MHLELVSLVVPDYDLAIDFFVTTLGFDLVADSPAVTSADGRPKRWVVVRAPGADTGLLLARADGDQQEQIIGRQFAGRVGLFLRVTDFGAAYDRMTGAGVEFVGEPRREPYGQVAVFVDIAGNRWDLLGPPDLPTSLSDVRSQIDDLDTRLVELLGRREALVRTAAGFKRDEDAVRAPARVEQVIAGVREKAARAGLDPQVAESVWRAMITAFVELELAHHHRTIS